VEAYWRHGRIEHVLNRDTTWSFTLRPLSSPGKIPRFTPNLRLTLAAWFSSQDRSFSDEFEAGRISP